MKLLAIFSLIVAMGAGVLLVLAVLIQDDQGESLGGLFAGSSSSVFGGRGSHVLQRFTTFLAVLFFLGAVSYSLITKTRKVTVLPSQSSTQATENSKPWWTESSDVNNESDAIVASE
jgi:preprotein translocase subunit SecG